jgi:hypothetical protein
MKQIKLPKIRKYHVLIPQGKSIATDNPNLAEKKAILDGGRYKYETSFIRHTSPQSINYTKLITTIQKTKRLTPNYKQNYFLNNTTNQTQP